MQVEHCFEAAITSLSCLAAANPKQSQQPRPQLQRPPGKEHQTLAEGTEKLTLRSHVPKKLNMGWTWTAINTGVIYHHVLQQIHQARAEVGCQR